MDHLDFLNVAKNLKSSHYEAERRSAVSRAYYAVYHHIRTYLIENNLVAHDAHLGHQKPIEFLKAASKDSGRIEFEELSKALDNLESDRRDADYNLQLTKFNQLTCELLYLKSCQVIDLLNQYKGKELVDNIKTYLKQAGYNIPYR